MIPTISTTLGTHIHSCEILHLKSILLHTGYLSSKIELEEQLNYKHKRLEKGWLIIKLYTVCHTKHYRMLAHEE